MFHEWNKYVLWVSYPVWQIDFILTSCIWLIAINSLLTAESRLDFLLLSQSQMWNVVRMKHCRGATARLRVNTCPNRCFHSYSICIPLVLHNPVMIPKSQCSTTQSWSQNPIVPTLNRRMGSVLKSLGCWFLLRPPEHLFWLRRLKFRLLFTRLGVWPGVSCSALKHFDFCKYEV